MVFSISVRVAIINTPNPWIWLSPWWLLSGALAVDVALATEFRALGMGDRISSRYPSLIRLYDGDQGYLLNTLAIARINHKVWLHSRSFSATCCLASLPSHPLLHRLTSMLTPGAVAARELRTGNRLVRLASWMLPILDSSWNQSRKVSNPSYSNSALR